MGRLLCIAKEGTSINGYGIRKNEIVEVTHINIEVGKKSLLTFKDMYGNTHVLDDKGFFNRFKYSEVLGGKSER